MQTLQVRKNGAENNKREIGFMGTEHDFSWHSEYKRSRTQAHQNHVDLVHYFIDMLLFLHFGLDDD